jgi:FMN phosphatase YigB (HAD superfamily)
MKFIDNELVVMFDCDDTLVMHNDQGNLLIEDPYNTYTFIDVERHERHIKLLKDFKGRGYTVVVWSAAGAKWAMKVVEALKLEDYVDLVISKPLKYVDDLPAEKILGSRIYLSQKGNLQNEV